MSPLILSPDRLAHILKCCLAVMIFTLGGEATAGENDQTVGENDQMVLGLGAAVIPDFEGSDDYQVEPVPLIDVQKGRFFAKSRDGIGFNLLEHPRFTIGASVAWMRGYDEDDVPQGIGELDNAIGGRVFVATHLGGVVAKLSVTQALDDDDDEERGLVANAGISYPYRATERLTLIPGVAVNWANDMYMNSYFGVDASRAANSGLALYEPSAGFKDVSLHVTINYQLNKDWSLAGAIGISRLLDKAADSPFVERESQLRAVMGLTYTF